MLQRVAPTIADPLDELVPSKAPIFSAEKLTHLDRKPEFSRLRIDFS